MKALRALLVPALAAGGLAAAVDAPAQAVNGATRSMSTGSTAAITRHAGTHRGSFSGGQRHWGGGRHWGGNHWGGHHHHGHWHGRVGFYFGVPLVWSSWYWGWPYYYDPLYYPRSAVVYREVERVPAYEGEMAPATTEVQPGPGSPTQGPLYMNYCESAKAYYPKVASCPEGWKFIAPKP